MTTLLTSALTIDSKIDQPGFMIACDSRYFTQWAKTLVMSIRTHAAWAHVHFHLFDPTEQDLAWAKKADCTVTTETIPADHLGTDEERVLYLAAARYMRVREIYTDNTVLINQDADSIMVRDLTKDEFLRSLERSWVPTAAKREQLSLCSAFGVGADDTRHTICDRYSSVYGTADWIFAYDQRVMDQMLAAGEITAMDLRYTDYKFGEDSYIWTGKGNRVYKKKFTQQQAKYLPHV
jgi:hypothetical protein